MKKCNVKNMGDYLDNFNPIRQKYDVFKSANMTLVAPFVFAEAARFDDAYQYGPLNKQEYSGIQQNLHLVYGNSETVKKDIGMYYKVKEKIIHRYLALPLLSQMFDEDYFNFEWDMHVGQNFTEHRGSFYRDHFIHQVRNMYMMETLLSDGLYNAVMGVLANKKNGKIAEYTCLKLEQFMLDNHSKEYQLFEKFLPKIKEELVTKQCIAYELLHDNKGGAYKEKKVIGDLESFVNHVQCYRKYYDSNEYKGELEEPTLSSIDPNTIKEIKQSVLHHTLTTDDYAYHYFFNYVIHASAYMSALFHDMGYPICHYLEVRGRLSKYNPAMYMITQNTAGSFDNIASKLSDSLLFTIVSHDEIKQRLEWQGSKYDHGAYSAIAFLLQYYETGAILRLSPEKQCAFELAAIAIYNHTLDYACADKNPEESKRNYYKPYFKQNPISFLLHFCDDLEEWDRRYFEISDAPALSICSECGGVLMPQIIDNDTVTGAGKVWDHPQRYNEIWGEGTYPTEMFDCFCSYNSSHHKCFRRQVFHKRQIFLVTTSPEVLFEKIGVSLPIYRANIQYDYFRLLKMSQINNTYAKYRLKDIKELKCRSSEQDYMKQEANLGFNDMYIDCFMSANPILTKIKLLERAVWSEDINSKKKMSRQKPIRCAPEVIKKIDSIMSEGMEGHELAKIRDELKGILTSFQIIVDQHIISKEEKEIVEAILPVDTSNSSLKKLFDYLTVPTLKNKKRTRLDFYISLLNICLELRIKFHELRIKLCELSKLTNEESKKTKDTYLSVLKASCDTAVRAFKKFWLETGDAFYESVLSELLWDCIYQYARELDNHNNEQELLCYMNDLFLDEYKTLYMAEKEREDAFYDAVLKYCCDTNGFNQYFNDVDNKYVGYFGDLFFFEKLNDHLYDKEAY